MRKKLKSSDSICAWVMKRKRIMREGTLAVIIDVQEEALTLHSSRKGHQVKRMDYF
jgi:hypothetical protein